MGTQRSCREREALPLLNDFVEVLWLLDDDDDEATWCRAHVADIEEAPIADADDKLEVLATATLEYDPTSAYAALVHQVEFLIGRLVRRAEPEGEENENPVLTWRTPTLGNAHEYDEDMDGDWTKDANHSKRRRVGVADQHRLRELTETVDRLRKSHAHVLGQVDMLTRKVESNRCRISEGLSSTRDESIVKIMNFLRQRLEVAVQKSLRKPSKPYEQSSADNETFGAVGGVSQSFIRVVADCELADFELIARNLYGRAVEDSTLKLQFYPEYADTQGPAGSSQTFYIIFSRMSGLCSFLGLMHKADRLEILKKEGSAGVGLLRVMGTYVYGQEVADPAAVFVGHSCGGTFRRDNFDARAGEFVLFRNNRIWDTESKTYDAGLRATRRRPSKIDDPNISSTVPLSSRAFHLVWRRGQEVSGRWSKGSRKRTVRVPGQLAVVIPYVLFVGDTLCADARRELSDEVLNEIVGPLHSTSVGQQEATDPQPLEMVL